MKKAIAIFALAVIAIWGVYEAAGAYTKKAVSSFVANELNMGANSDNLDKAAALIGADADKLKTDLGNGKTLGETLGAQNISKEELRSVAKTELSAWLEARIQEGNMTEGGKVKILDKFDNLYDSQIDYILSLDATELSNLQLVR